MKEIKYPSDWQSVILGDICYVNKNSLSEKTPKDYNFKYIDLSAVDRGKIQLSNQYIAFKDAPCRARRIIYRDDIIMSTVRPNLQGFAFVDFDSNDIICSTGFAVLTAKEQTSNKYIYQLLYSKEIETQIKNMLVGSNYPAINSSDVASLKIFLPPLAEQKKIAEILETWDRAIEELSDLITEKKELKRGLMQQLLTGAKRLPDFTKPWSHIQLKQLGECIRGVSYKPTDLKDKDAENTVRLLRSSNIQNNKLILTDLKIVPIYLVQESQILQQGDIVICMANGSKELVGKTAKYDIKNCYRYTVGAFCAIFRFRDGIIKNFFAYYFLTKQYFDWINIITSGSSINNLKNEDIESFKIDVPSDIEEQKAIAGVLAKADAEIDLLNQQLDVLKEQKRGLMQKLLTGEIRVKVDTETC